MKISESLIEALGPPTLSFTLPMPPSVNAAYQNAKGKGRVKSAKYLQWMRAAGSVLMSRREKIANRKLPPGYIILYQLNKTDNIKRDCANYEKCLSDYLTQMNIIEDDSLIQTNIQQWIKDPHLGRQVRISIWSNVHS